MIKYNDYEKVVWIHTGPVNLGDTIKYILADETEHEFVAMREGFHNLPSNTRKAWVNDELKVDLTEPFYQITDGPIIVENITIDQRYVFEQKIKILTEALEYFANNLWTKPELQGMYWKEAIETLENKAKEALEKVK